MLVPIVASAAVVLFLADAVEAKPFTAEEAAKVDRVVEDILRRTQVPSASIAVVRDGELAFAKSYGTQSPETGMASKDTIYRAASLSKQFTSAAILLLRNQGKLSLDDTVAKYVQGVTAGDRITIRQLLNHTSGLRSYWPHDYKIAAMAKPVTPQQIINHWGKFPLDFEPGTKWSYSDTGYVLAGMIIEKAAGQPYMDFMKDNIFRPLGLNILNGDTASGRGFAAGYKRDALGPVRLETPPAKGWLFATGGLAMTASDMARWNAARINRTFLPKESWEEQEREAKLPDGSSTGYGLGVGLGMLGTHKYVQHGGSIVGVRNENVVFPEDRDAIVVLTNGGFSNARNEIRAGIMKVLYPDDGADDAKQVAMVRKLYDQLRTGTIDSTLLTDNAKSYFTDTVLADHRQSLSSLGEPKSITPTGGASQEGGFNLQRFTITVPDRTLEVSLFTETGDGGKVEQFLVAPAN